MATVTTRATLDDLLKTDGKAELIGGKIVHFMVSGFQPSVVAARDRGEPPSVCEDRDARFRGGRRHGVRRPRTSFGSRVLLSGCGLFRRPATRARIRFVEGLPALAVEVRSENDYGPAAEVEIVTKRSNYFAAGTLVVWDVDPVTEQIHVYRSTDPEHPTTYARGQTAEADPAVPGWRMAVNDIVG